MSFCEHCVKGVRHEGNPEGKWEEVGGVKCYVATPSTDYPKDKAIIYIPDIFGVQLVNHQLLADDYAANGFKVYVPDIFHDDAPSSAFDPGVTFDFMEWFSRNGADVTEPVVRKLITTLKEQGVTKFGGLGYCYGARLCFNLAFENILNVVVVSHPSLLQVPDDFNKYVAQSKAPLLINSCEVDQQLPIEAQQKADETFGDGKFAPGYLRTYWPGCVHGFTVRGDMNDPKVKAGKEGAFKASVEFLIKHL